MSFPQIFTNPTQQQHRSLKKHQNGSEKDQA